MLCLYLCGAKSVHRTHSGGGGCKKKKKKKLVLFNLSNVFSFFLSPGVLCFSELFFIKEPRDVTVMRRDSVILDCQAHGESPIDVRWLKNGVSVVESERVYLLSNGSLYISEVESRRGDKSDEGLYQCLAQNRYGAILSQKARLTIASKCLTRNVSARMFSDGLLPSSCNSCWVEICCEFCIQM